MSNWICLVCQRENVPLRYLQDGRNRPYCDKHVPKGGTIYKVSLREAESRVYSTPSDYAVSSGDCIPGNTPAVPPESKLLVGRWYRLEHGELGVYLGSGTVGRFNYPHRFAVRGSYGDEIRAISRETVDRQGINAARAHAGEWWRHSRCCDGQPIKAKEDGLDASSECWLNGCLVPIDFGKGVR